MLNILPNKGKKLDIVVDDEAYYRYPIKTHYVQPKESYIEIIKSYIIPIYEDGDIISISEKIIALSQNRIVYKKDIKVGFWAKLLSRFVHVTPAGESVGNVYKMQIAINLAGLPKILFAAFCAAVTRPFGIKGVFYKIAGNGISGVDGFCNDAFDDYLEMGILNPDKPDDVCNDIKKQLGVSCMIVDANDLNVEILGKSSDIQYPVEYLMRLIKDNPAGQANQQTPITLIRRESIKEEASATIADAVEQ